MFFFFFKRKTAYEMRISDWSSDVCSSDLEAGMAEKNQGADKTEKPTPKKIRDARKEGNVAKSRELTSTVLVLGWLVGGWLLMGFMYRKMQELFDASIAAVGQPFEVRSEEHTSELQSLMRSSYAVVCSK